MDPASLALSIAALYTTCRDCYSFFTAVTTAESDSSAQLRNLEIQQSILKAWGFHWRIDSQDGLEAEGTNHVRPKRTKLHDYLSSNRFKAEGVFSTLSALADTLSNQEKLVKRYGVLLQPSKTGQDIPHLTNNVQLTITNTTIEDVKPVIGEVKKRLSMLNKFKWAMKDKDKFKELLDELRSHSDALYRLCPENAFESMNIYFTMECLAKQELPQILKWTSQIAMEQAQVNGTSSVHEGYRLLASAATLKASVNENRDRRQANNESLSVVEEETRKMVYLGRGLALFDEQIVYVEMRDYRGAPLVLTAEQIQQRESRRRRARHLKSASKYGSMPQLQNLAELDSLLEELEEVEEPVKPVRPADPKLRALIQDYFNTFKVANMAESVRGLDIVSMIDHTAGEATGRCSILYKLPGTIGVRSRERPAENLKLRAPVTLASLLGVKKKGIRSSLGARYELARQLVRAVCLLHTSGWLHKNIRAESVIFFPEHVDAIREDQYRRQIEIDVTKPILMGYIFSRPDDVVVLREKIQSRQEEIEEEAPVPPVTERTKGLSNYTMTYSADGTPLRPQSNAIPQVHHYRDRRRRHGKAAGREETEETTVGGFTLDYYQHPAKHADPTRLYRHAYDVYSLGIILLEIGLWKKLKDYDSSGRRHGSSSSSYDSDMSSSSAGGDDDEKDHYEQRRWICYQYLDDLRWKCGDTYADVVLSCLMIDSSDDEVAKSNQRELCARIVADLEGCQA